MLQALEYTADPDATNAGVQNANDGTTGRKFAGAMSRTLSRGG